MKIIIDERETALFDKCQSLITAQPIPSFVILSKQVLQIGDILFQTDDGLDVLIIERKSFNDLLSSIKDGRYEEQSYRLLHSSGFPPHSIFYLLEGMFSQLRTPMEKKIIYSSMTSLQFFKGFSLCRTASLSESADWILYMADKIERQFSKGIVPYYLTEPFSKLFKKSNVNADFENPENVLETSDSIPENVSIPNYCTVVKKTKKDNITPANIGEIILCQIPGISSNTAIAIMKKFNGFPHFIDEIRSNPSCLENVFTESNGKSRKISKSCVDNIHRFLVSNTQN